MTPNVAKIIDHTDPDTEEIRFACIALARTPTQIRRGLPAAYPQLLPALRQIFKNSTRATNKRQAARCVALLAQANEDDVEMLHWLSERSTGDMQLEAVWGLTRFCENNKQHGEKWITLMGGTEKLKQLAAELNVPCITNVISRAVAAHNGEEP